MRPSGTVTFMFTDIEASARLWEQQPDAMRMALQRHDEIVASAVVCHDGTVFSTSGDGVAAAFQRSEDVVRAAIDLQTSLLAENWPTGCELKVRVGVRTGEAQERGGDYFGAPLNCAARVIAAANGGQTVISHTTAEVLGNVSGLELIELGTHLLRGLSQPTRLLGLTVARKQQVTDDRAPVPISNRPRRK